MIIYKHIRLINYLLGLLLLMSSCQAQPVASSETHARSFGLKGKVKSLKTKLCGALIDLKGNILIEKYCITPKDLAKPYTRKFNEQGYLTYHNYYTGNKENKDYYFYKNDSILERKENRVKVVIDHNRKDVHWWPEKIFKYNEKGEVVFLGYGYIYEDKHPLEESDFIYDKKGNVKEIVTKSYNYDPQSTQGNPILDSIVTIVDKVKNVYENDLLISRQFTNEKGEILLFDKEGEIGDKFEDTYIEGLDWNAQWYTIGDKTIYQYDAAGHRSDITTISAYGKSSTNSYTYYPDGKLKSSIYRDVQGKTAAIEEFNEEGDRTYYRSYYGNKYTYEYTERDDKNNWIVCKIDKNGEPYYFETREIEYYE